MWLEDAVGMPDRSRSTMSMQEDQMAQTARPVTLFTGQWADLPLETLAQKVSAWGFDGLELACWGDHFEVDKALESDSYVREKRDLLDKYNLKYFAISNHLVGQCVCDPIDI